MDSTMQLDSGASYQLKGALGSPFSMKMRAVLRYRRLPHVWQGGRVGFAAAQQMKARVIPVLVMPDGEAVNETTHLIRVLEKRHPHGRSLVPDDPAAAFLALLFEDLADEWLSKAMYGYRWARTVDQTSMSLWLAYDVMRGGGAEAVGQMADIVRDRQVGRREIVGCGDEAQPLIEASVARILAALDAHVVRTPYLFGDRPTAAEFAIYGQISQLAEDPTPSALLRADYPWLYRWRLQLDDLSGEPDGDWAVPPDLEAPVLRALLEVCGSDYLPILAANARAVATGQQRFTCRIATGDLVQPADRWQIKCLRALQLAWAQTPAVARDMLSKTLEATGCLAILSGADVVAGSAA